MSLENLMNLDNTSLLSFITVAETGSFTVASKRLCRTQSAISQQISKLEKQLSRQLFIRGKQLTLTSDGEVLIGYARKIFILQCEILDRFREPELKGEVRFGLPEDFAALFLPEVLADFSRIHPLISLKIECDLTLNLYDRFRSQELDLVLVKMNCPEAFPNGVDVWSEPLMWVGDENLIEPDRPVPLVLSPSPCVYRSAAIQSLEAAGRSWRVVLSSPSYAGITAAVRAGMGITTMPQIMIPNDLDSIDSQFLPSLSDIHVSLLKYREDNPSVNTLSTFVMKKLRR